MENAVKAEKAELHPRYLCSHPKDSVTECEDNEGTVGRGPLVKFCTKCKSTIQDMVTATWENVADQY